MSVQLNLFGRARARRTSKLSPLFDVHGLSCRVLVRRARAVLTGHGVDVLCSDLNARDDQDGVEHEVQPHQACVRSTVRAGVIPKRRNGGKRRCPSFVSTRRALSSTAVSVYRCPLVSLLDCLKSVRHRPESDQHRENDTVDRQERIKSDFAHRDTPSPNPEKSPFHLSSSPSFHCSPTMAAVNDPTAAFQSEGGADAKPVEVDLTKLTALSPEVIMNQATVSVAMRPFALFSGKSARERGCREGRTACQVWGRASRPFDSQ